MKIKITGKNMELTEAIENYVEKKVSDLEKFYDKIMRANVVLGLETKHHLKGANFFCECQLDVPGKELFAKKNEKDLYKAIDKIRDYLESELKKFKVTKKEKTKKDKRAVRSNKEYQD